MNIVPGNAPMPVGAAAMPMAPASRAYTVKPAGQDDNDQKEITTEQIQAMLDENSSLIVEIINLNNQIKHEKGNAVLSELTDKLDKKRKKLNKNLMTLAKWADESSEQPARPQPPPAAYAPQPAPQAAYGRPMPMNPMAMAHPQMQVPRYAAPAAAQAHMQAQAQALAQAQAQYQARLSSMGARAPYGAMPPTAVPPRYHEAPAMGPYGAMHPMAMAPPMPQGYVGYTMPPGYGMMAPQAMARMPGPSGHPGGAMPTTSAPDVSRSGN
ncbi:hypothetical protein P43SY_007848 [Pythium insidiosum]|uniref:SS18 N-terminal domain-containing protein n=1 Tax=Pythium insidiosum TaxID=114742 RepID=A0AAD5M5C9_PYTIN|nr:hypothetical protein P43SY_007848 [Pythium insidiosum]